MTIKIVWKTCRRLTKRLATSYLSAEKLEVGKTYFIPQGKIINAVLDEKTPAQIYVKWEPQKKGASKSHLEHLAKSGPFLFEESIYKFLVMEGGKTYKLDKQFGYRNTLLFLAEPEVNLDGFFYHEIDGYWGYIDGITSIAALSDVTSGYIENQPIKFLGFKQNNYIFEAGGKRILWNKNAAMKCGDVFQTIEQKNAVPNLDILNEKFTAALGTESVQLLNGNASYVSGITRLYQYGTAMFLKGKFKEVIYFKGLNDKKNPISAGYFLKFENDLVSSWKEMYFPLENFDKIYVADPACYLKPRKTANTECLYTKKEKNGFDGSITITTPTRPIGVVEFPYFDYSYTLSRLGDSYFMIVYPSWDKGCSTNDSYIAFKFADGTVIESKHATDIDCKAKAAISILISKDLFVKLQISELQMIRVVQSKGSVDLTVLSTNAIANQLRKCMHVE